MGKIISSLAKLLTAPFIFLAFRKMKKIAETPEGKKTLDDYQKSHQKLMKQLDEFCQKYPDHPFCQKEFRDLVL